VPSAVTAAQNEGRWWGTPQHDYTRTGLCTVFVDVSMAVGGGGGGPPPGHVPPHLMQMILTTSVRLCGTVNNVERRGVGW